MTVFCKNLKHFRQQKHLTQEQAAEALGVSAQIVSRWECGTTLPDVTVLPRIARLYGILVDDLYQEKTSVYASFANRLLAVYERSGRTEDFLAAEQEFSRIPEDALTADDLRSLGVLYHYMMKDSAAKALRRLDQALAHPDIPEDVYSSTAQQKIALMCDLGRGKEEAARYDQELALRPNDPQCWLLCTAAHYMAGEQQKAMETAREGIRRFPENAALHIYSGYISQDEKNYDAAFFHWQQALKIDPEFWDARYATGFCLEEMGDYARAREVWGKLAADLERRGFEEEVSLPRTREAFCAEQCKL